VLLKDLAEGTYQLRDKPGSGLVTQPLKHAGAAHEVRKNNGGHAAKQKKGLQQPPAQRAIASAKTGGRKAFPLMLRIFTDIREFHSVKFYRCKCYLRLSQRSFSPVSSMPAYSKR
jgi:hypothetical protein